MPDLRHGTIDTVLGELTLVANGDNLRALYFPRALASAGLLHVWRGHRRDKRRVLSNSKGGTR